MFIAYKREQQPNINAGVEKLELHETGGPAWVELPAAGLGAVLFSSFVDNGMRSGSHRLRCGRAPSQFIRAEVRSTGL